MGRLALPAFTALPRFNRVVLLRVTLLVVAMLALTGCPTKDWVKRDEAYLTVEQYKIMSEVISINDTLYRVKKGEEINQNKITQVFINLQQYISTPRNEKNARFRGIRKTYRSEKTAANALTYALVLLERKGNEGRASKVLAGISKHKMTEEEKNLVNLAHILSKVLRAEAKLKRKHTQLTQAHELIQEEVSYLNKQINALKFIEESIHAREVSVK